VEYQAGRFKLPSELSLAEALHVSRISLREVIKELAQEGVIYSLHGKGTFINCNYKSLKVKLTPAVEFGQAINACGYEASVEVLSVNLHTPDSLTAQELDLKKGEQIYTIHKVFFADGMPVIFCEDIFPLSLLQGHSLTKEEIEASTFEVLLERGGVQVSSDIADLLACTTDDLKMFKPYSIKEKPLALLQLHSVYYTLRQKPVLKVNAYFDTRYIRLSMLRRQDVYSSDQNHTKQEN
jgi:GntR family transcriptional regulator